VKDGWTILNRVYVNGIKKQAGNGQRQYRMEKTVLETKVYKGLCAGEDEED
jgi:hypothetical protein